MVADINTVSDFDFYSDYARELSLISSPTILARLEFSRNSSWTSLNVRELRRKTLFSDDSSLLQQSLPEVEWRGRSRRLGRTPAYLSFESSLASIQQRERDKPSPIDADYYRADISPTLTVPWAPVPWLDINPVASYRWTYYTQYQVRDGSKREIVDDPLSRGLFAGGLEVIGPKFYRVYERPDNPFSTRYKHSVETRVVWGYAEPFARTAEIIPFDEVDRVSGSGNQINYSLVQRLFAQRPRVDPPTVTAGTDIILLPDGTTSRPGEPPPAGAGPGPPPAVEPDADAPREPVEIGSLSLSQRRSFDNDAESTADLDGDGKIDATSPYSDVVIVGRYNPSTNVSLDLRGNYHILYNSFAGVTVSGGIRRRLAQIRFSPRASQRTGGQFTGQHPTAPDDGVQPAAREAAPGRGQYDRHRPARQPNTGARLALARAIRHPVLHVRLRAAPARLRRGPNATGRFLLPGRFQGDRQDPGDQLLSPAQPDDGGSAGGKREVTERQRPVLVSGGSGLLGRALVSELRRRGRSVDAPPRGELDLARGGAVDAWLDRQAPAGLINAAAYTDVGGAELAENLEEVMLLNREVPGRLARACSRHGVPLIHVSTDYVFDGRHDEPYGEQDPVAPLQVYGRSKLAGERAVIAEHPEALVARTSTLFGPGRRARSHYVDAVLRNARRHGRLELVRLPVSSPTYAPDLAEALVRLLEVEATGLVHVVNRGGCSRIDLASEAMRIAGERYRAEVVVRPAAPGGPARPPYSVLDVSLYESLSGATMRTWKEALACYLADHRP